MTWFLKVLKSAITAAIFPKGFVLFPHEVSNVVIKRGFPLEVCLFLYIDLRVQCKTITWHSKEVFKSIIDITLIVFQKIISVYCFVLTLNFSMSIFSNVFFKNYFFLIKQELENFQEKRWTKWSDISWKVLPYRDLNSKVLNNILSIRGFLLMWVGWRLQVSKLRI